jgi:hypothetical protein
MFRASIFTLYPDFFPGPLGQSLSGDALARGLWALETRQIRDHGLGRHKSVDDTPAGGGPGMVIRADVLAASLDAGLQADDPRPRLLMSPRGRPLTQSRVRELAQGVVAATRVEGFWRIFLMQLATYPAFAAILGLWSGPWLADVYGMTVEARGGVLFAMVLAQIAGLFFWGASDRLFGSYKIPALMGAGLSAALLAYGALGPLPQGAVLPFVIALGFAFGFSPVLTAHPTEVQRKSILDAERDIAHLLAERDAIKDRALPKDALAPRELAANEAQLRARVMQLWQTRLLRFTKLTVADEIENALSEHPAVLSCLVVGVPHEDLGQVPHALVHAADPSDHPVPDEAAIKAFVAERLAEYKVPRSMEFVDSPLRDDAGKARRTAVRDEVIARRRT